MPALAPGAEDGNRAIPDRALSAAMLNMLSARSRYQERWCDMEAQVQPPDEVETPRADMPWLRKGPTGEGYCRSCHFIVGTYRRKLIKHAGYWARWTGGAVDKSPYRKGELNESLVVWCPGSGRLPSPMPENPWDPWESDVKEDDHAS